jgi:hypothetical protein
MRRSLAALDRPLQSRGAGEDQGRQGRLRNGSPAGRAAPGHNKLPVYTYAHEGLNQVLCDNVDGWFVVRV